MGEVVVKQDKSLLAENMSSLIMDLRGIIEQARVRVAETVCNEQTMMYWRIGKRINCDILEDKRAAYGGKLSRQCRDNYKMSSVEMVLLKKMFVE
jgi:hypothetical protein